MKKLKDFTGMKIGYVEVLTSHERRKVGKHTKIYWECKCICGNVCHISSAYLLKPYCKSKPHSGVSCGCKNDENMRKHVDPKEASYNKLFSSYKSNAKNKNREFNISYDKFKSLILSNCIYCGVAPYTRYNAHARKTGIKIRSNSNAEMVEAAWILHNGIDRIDSDQGYVESNIVSCCFMCNAAKLDYSFDEFRVYIDRVVAKWGK